ncbi:hypothetical protein [Siphonobacter sp. SORGH_AS_0500]|uniref:hypothetical protein n=1 Tax=Siphonobacter sp. SORGH_AS_0500 TaxID=1864824 RepID=UPI0012FEE713|nr:hypothetical protein [Siphonobacter sp. SORGH_AS_0500]MDR6196841.1 hypothetical protein [Siphonobacter sp. SORGH_AS_0500]
MMRVLFTFLILGAGLYLASCTTEPDFSNVPNLLDGSTTISKTTNTDRLGNAQDSLVIGVKFQDGDGDLGLSSNMYPDSVLIKEGYNYEVKTLRRIRGQFQDVTQSFGVSNSGNFPRLRQDNKVGPIEGTLSRSIMIPHLAVSRNDTLKFRIRIKDRALNVSNEVETPSVILRVQQ